MIIRKCSLMVASLLGIFAGFGGPEHGYFEMLQGQVRPNSLFFSAIGPPCNPEVVWNRCEPAMSILPSFWLAGLLSVVIGLIIMVWSAFFLRRRHAGWVLVILCIGLLLAGGGLFPPVIGIIAGLMVTRIRIQFRTKAGRLTRVFAVLWPWPLVAFFIWVFGQFVIGHYFNDWLRNAAMLVPILVGGLLALAALSGFGRDHLLADQVMADGG